MQAKSVQWLDGLGPTMSPPGGIHAARVERWRTNAELPLHSQVVRERVSERCLALVGRLGAPRPLSAAGIARARDRSHGRCTRSSYTRWRWRSDSRAPSIACRTRARRAALMTA
jgi:hypothetical protein